jgi:hypothetical protein
MLVPPLTRTHCLNSSDIDLIGMLCVMSEKFFLDRLLLQVLSSDNLTKVIDYITDFPNVRAAYKVVYDV